MELQDLIILITGGASGLGASTAQYLARHGAKIVILDVNQQAAMDVAAEINGLGLVCDVTSEASVNEALRQAKLHFGVPRICINFAGILDGGRVVSRSGPMDLEHFRNVVNIDLIGTFNVMRLALADMMQLEPLGDSLERGVVINISSIAASEGQIGQVAYSASKAGVAGMTLPVAREMADYGIRVVCIAPGVFETPMMQNASDKIRSTLLESTVFPKRFGNPIEIAKFVEHIIVNSMLNGDVLRIDGAMRMPAK